MPTEKFYSFKRTESNGAVTFLPTDKLRVMQFCKSDRHRKYNDRVMLERVSDNVLVEVTTHQFRTWLEKY